MLGKRIARAEVSGFTNHVKVVTLGSSEMPHPESQACASTQPPTSPQSLTARTVVGQKPHMAFFVSTLQSKPGFAVLGRLAFPLR